MDPSNDHHAYCTGDFNPNDIVISGIGGRFPDCNTVGELEEALFKKKLLFNTENVREKILTSKTVSGLGFLREVDKFDADYFCYPHEEADEMDPEARIGLEVTYEAIADAGYDPHTLRGANIGVYNASIYHDREFVLAYNQKRPRHFWAKSLKVHHISYAFDFIGPSITADTGCSSSAVAMWIAFNDLKEGKIDAAVVTGCQLNFLPYLAQVYCTWGVGTPTGNSIPFDASSDGLARTESVISIFLQKASIARRAYVKIMGTKFVTAGCNPEGISVPSEKYQIKCIHDVLKDSGISPMDIDYIESHGTGTATGDPIELNAIAAAYSVNERTKPVLVGSVKSTVGHTEACAGICSILKAIICCETGLIAPHCRFTNPNPLCQALVDGKLKVVTEATPLETPYVPVNSFGFGGTIVHTILKQNSKISSKHEVNNGLPKLVLYSATTDDAVQFVFDYIKNNPHLSDEFFALLNKLSFGPRNLKPVRGYAFFEDKNNPSINIKSSEGYKRDVWFIYSGLGGQWRGMGTHLMKIDIFAESMKKSAGILKKCDIDLFEILSADRDLLEIEGKWTPLLTGIVAIEIALTDVLSALEVHPDGIIGHGIGEITAAYADGCITAEEALQIAFNIGAVSEKLSYVNGAFFTVGLSWKEAKERCPKHVYPVCDNSDDSVTIAGSKKEVFQLIEKLKKENVSCSFLPSNGLVIHCPFTNPMVPKLAERFRDILKQPKSRSKRWITTSLSAEQDDSKFKIFGPDYIANMVNSPVYFKEAINKIPRNAVTIEIGPDALFQQILQKDVGRSSAHFCLMNRNEAKHLNLFFNTLGKLYIEGLEPKIEKLYPPVQFPVSRATPRICDLIKWNHSVSYDIPKWMPTKSVEVHKFHIEDKDSYLLDHHIDGRSLFPATGYIYLAWKSLANMLNKNVDTFPVMVENFKIHRATVISAASDISFTVNILSESGHFEIINDNTAVASGKVCELKKIGFVNSDPFYEWPNVSAVPGAALYNELKMTGYEYGPRFQGLHEVTMDGTQGLVQWQDKWVSFLDSLLLFFGMLTNPGSFELPVGMQSIKIDPNIFNQHVKQIQDGEKKYVPVNYNPATNVCYTFGIEITNLKTNPAPRRIKNINPNLEEYTFIPYTCKYDLNKSNDIQIYMEACNRMLDKLGDHLKLNVQNYKFRVGECEVNMKEYLENLSEKQSLLYCLKSFTEDLGDAKKKELCLNYLNVIGKDILNSAMTCEDALRIMLEIIAENSYRKMNLIELNNSNFPILLPSVNDIVRKFSYLKSHSNVLITTENVKTDTEELSEHGILLSGEDSLVEMQQEKDRDLVISSFMTGTRTNLQTLVQTVSSIVKTTGFIIFYFKEQISPVEKLLLKLSGEDFQLQSTAVLEETFEKNKLIIVSKINDSIGNVAYVLRPFAPINSFQVIKTFEDGFKWIEELKTAMASDTSDPLWLVAEDTETNGVVGMVNCLKQEPKGDRIRCMFLTPEHKNSRPAFNFEHSFYKQVLMKNIVMNVWKNGSWGSYRHAAIKGNKELKKVEHSYVNCRKFGDLSSFEWVESYVKYAEKSSLVHIYYSALNFKDVMLATGKLSSETSVKNPDKVDDSILGLEFSGRDQTGKRVAGIVSGSGIATSTLVDPTAIIDVPNSWSLEDAATVPVVYATCYYALVVRAQLQEGESVLIHSGTGGIGIAAINIALSLKCEVFTTVGNEQKKIELQKMFPQIKEKNIGCSRNTSFKNMIKERTKGRGVDVVLNSLADDKFQASVHCVAKHGRFVEIGKYDLSLDRTIGLKLFLDNITFHGVFLDQLFENTPSARSNFCHVMQLVRNGIKQNVVKPLHRTVFKSDEVENAFRYMAKGVHVGKVLLKIRDEEPEKRLSPINLSLPAVPITYFYPSKVYIVIGGLGGFGIEVTKWIISRGGRRIILTSRYGAKTPYHHLCLKRWKKKGADVKIMALDASKYTEAEKLLQEATKIGPVGGIINSAVVLKDSFIDSQNVKKYEEVCAPKAAVSKHLDTLSRKLCPSLDYFICFSSISCGRGNAGQTNYGYANSVMERICEIRREAGLHGLAIQWGIIGEVGVVHRHMGDDAMIAGFSAQSVKSCLEALDLFCQAQYPVVTSYMTGQITKSETKVDIVGQISKILGIKTGGASTRTFGEMGLDSLMGVEIKQILDTAFDVSLSMTELMDLRLTDVKTMVEKTADTKKSDTKKVTSLVSTADITLPPKFLHNEDIISLNKETKLTPIFIIHIGDTDVNDFHSLSQSIQNSMYALPWTKSVPADNMETIASWYLKLIRSKVQGRFHLIGYSLGGSLAFEIALRCQKSPTRAESITLMDGSTHLLKNLNKEKEGKHVDASILCKFIEQFSIETFPKLESELQTIESLDKKIATVLQFLTASCPESANKPDLSDAVSEYLKRTKIINSYLPNSKLSGNITLIENPLKVLANDISEIKSLFSQICTGNVDVHRLLPKHELSNKDTVHRLLEVLKF